jgi:hypothetical protein
MAAAAGSLQILLDMHAALDTVDHPTLLKCLRDTIGLSGPALSWFHS